MSVNEVATAFALQTDMLEEVFTWIRMHCTS